jgi:PTH1 family peptidyl-tRNA hydrolase
MVLPPNIKLIISIGNPGHKYEKTRHNAGHIILDLLLEDENFSKTQVKMFKSDSFMNDSGIFVKSKLNYYRLVTENLLIIHDDLDISLGDYKLQRSRGPKVHNGLLSIEQHLRTKDFWRLRIGIDNRIIKSGSGSDYVLGEFSADEILELKSIFTKNRKKL